ncbi:MAG: metallophosphoesterase [Limisphaerales bacterium]
MFRKGLALWILVLARSLGWAETGVLISVAAPWRYEVLSGAPAPEGWEQSGYDDRGWRSGLAGFSAGLFGYDQAATVIPTQSQAGTLRGLVLRHAFELREPEAVEALTLRVDYEDGFVGWLNGVEVFRRGLPPGGAIRGTEVPLARFAGEVEMIDLTPFKDRLARGTNVLALMVLDASQFGGTVFAWPELRANFSRGPSVNNVTSQGATFAWRIPVAAESRLIYQRIGSADPESRITVPPGTNGVVIVTDLTPGSAYEYRVEWKGEERWVTSESARFRTFRESGDVEFLVVGDTGSGSTAQHAVAAMMAGQEADLVLHVGDISYPQFEDGQVDLRCLSAYEALMRRTPFFFTVGNHDFYDGDRAYLEAFELPTNSVIGTEHYYSFDQGDAHFVSLFVPWYGVSKLGEVLPDGSRSAPYRWLTNDLATTAKPWKIVFFHQPIRTSGPHILDDYDISGRPDVEEVRESILPALAEAGVQMVFAGHDHAWERFAPTNGVHTVVTGGGGAVLYPIYRPDGGSAQFVYRHHFVRGRIRGEEMRLEAVGSDGEVLDAFSVRRTGPNGVPRSMASRWAPLGPNPVGGGQENPNEDGNRAGERFELVGDGVLGMPGRSANPGRLIVNHDPGRVRVGIRDAMLWPGQTLLLFVGTAGRDGLTNLLGTGAAQGHPLGGLNLGFEGFQPAWVAMLGDEFADETLPGFRRRGDPVALGQGVFRMDAAMTASFGARVAQFNRSPEATPVPWEENADFMVIELSRREIGAERVGSTIQLGAVVVSPVTDGSGAGARLEMDSAYLGGGLEKGPGGVWRLEPIDFSLAEASAVDRDGDGLDEAREAALGTDPDHPDTDGDGLPDGWEVEHRLNPRWDKGDDGGDGDPDGDGYLNREEHASGTSPREPGTGLELKVKRVAGRIWLAWRATVGRVYDVEVATGLPGRFESAGLAGYPRRATTASETVGIDTAGATAGPRWYRIREDPAR